MYCDSVHFQTMQINSSGWCCFSCVLELAIQMFPSYYLYIVQQLNMLISNLKGRTCGQRNTLLRGAIFGLFIHLYLTRSSASSYGVCLDFMNVTELHEILEINCERATATMSQYRWEQRSTWWSFLRAHKTRELACSLHLLQTCWMHPFTSISCDRSHGFEMQIYACATNCFQENVDEKILQEMRKINRDSVRCVPFS